jgi:hypothetical protein
VPRVESYFWCPVPRFDAHPLDLADDEERASYLGTRWWSLDALAAPQGVWIAPSRLALLLRSLRDNGPPATPLDAGE